MLSNPHDKPILSDRSQTERRLKMEAKFAETFGSALIARGRAMDLDNLKFALQNAIAKQIWMLWRRGMSLGNGDASRELRLIGHNSLLKKDRANFALRLENLPARQAIFDRINLLSGNVADSEFDRIKDALGENIKGDIGRTELVAAISQVLGGDRFTARARTIARTELTAAYNTGKVQTYRENAVQAVRRYCIRDERTCPTCAGLNGIVARLDGADLSRLMPPQHPNCRCTLSPVLDMRQLIEAGRQLRSDVKPAWEIEGLSRFGYPCGNTFIPDRAKCYTDPRTGARLKVPLTKQQIEKVRSRSAGAERLYAEQESRVRRLARTDATEKGIRFPTSAELDRSQVTGMGFSDPDTKVSNFLVETPTGDKYIAKGNVTEYGSRNGRLDRTFEQIRKSEIATKEVADELNLGKYYLPVTERSVDIFKDGSGMKTPVILTPYIEGATKHKQINDIFDRAGLIAADDMDIPLSRMGKDLPKLVGMDYVLGNLNRKPPLVPPRGGVYMVDNGLNFAKHGDSHLYAELSPKYNTLLDGLNLEQKIDKSILKSGDRILGIAKKHGLPTSGILQRLEAMSRHKIWKDLIHNF